MKHFRIVTFIIIKDDLVFEFLGRACAPQTGKRGGSEPIVHVVKMVKWHVPSKETLQFLGIKVFHMCLHIDARSEIAFVEESAYT